MFKPDIKKKMMFQKNIHIFVANFLNLIFCNQLIISAFMFPDLYTLTARDFLRAVFGEVRSLSLLLNPRMQEKTSVYQQGICHNYSSIFFRDHQRPWLRFRWIIFCRCSNIRTDREGEGLSLTHIPTIMKAVLT